MANVIIRPATPADALAIATIHVASWQHVYRGVLPADALDAMTPDDRLPLWTYILGLADSPTSVGVAEMAGEVVGFHSVGRSDEGDPEDVQMLYTIYLLPAVERRGIGSALLADAERHMRLRGARSGVLRVFTANAGTRRFYERCGWVAEPGSERIEDAWGQQVGTIRYTKVFTTM